MAIQWIEVGEGALNNIFGVVSISERGKVGERHMVHVIGTPDNGIKVVEEDTGQRRGDLFRVWGCLILCHIAKPEVKIVE